MHLLQQPTSTNNLSSCKTWLPATMRAMTLSISCGMLLFGVAGCQATKGIFNQIEDGSLQYQQASQSKPLQLPADQETAPFIPLYPTPSVGVNTLDLENETGKRYKLPPPYRSVPSS